ncbi:hypothetical protein [Pseudomonas sp. PS01303]|uniref:hypothetical protein n=1 Tax=Pseudomonas sp. PS01303 TaxID=2991439 RepID=UPI00249CCD0C|nr:hypothetical protein [Pseudomonas sp. PS01303]
MPSSVAFQWLQFLLTIFGGILIFIVSQAVLKLVIEPVQHFKGAIGLTANTLLRHRGKLTNGMEDAELSAKVFDHAAELVSKAEVIVCYRLAAFLFRLPSRKNIVEASRELNGIGHETRDSNPPFAHSAKIPKPLSVRRNHDSLIKIAKLLRVKTAYE